MDKNRLKEILTTLYWYKDDLGNDQNFLLALRDFAIEIGDSDTERSIGNILAIEGKLWAGN